MSSNISDFPGKELPDLAGYPAHLRYQESIAFGQNYDPVKNMSNNITIYRTESTGAVSAATSTSRLDAAWLEAKLAALPLPSVERLLAAQPGRSRIVWFATGSWYAQLAGDWGAALLLFCLFPLLCLAGALASPSITAYAKTGALRGKWKSETV